MVGDEGGYAAGSSGFTAARERVPALCLRPVGGSLAQESGAAGDVIVVRYADDLVVGFQSRAEAERFLQEFRERLAKFGLELHAEKTRLIEFGRFAARNRKQREKENRRRSRSWGLRTTAASSGERGLHRLAENSQEADGGEASRIKAELRRQRHQPLALGRCMAGKAVLGYYQYHAIPGNSIRWTPLGIGCDGSGGPS